MKNNEIVNIIPSGAVKSVIAQKYPLQKHMLLQSDGVWGKQYDDQYHFIRSLKKNSAMQNLLKANCDLYFVGECKRENNVKLSSFSIPEDYNKNYVVVMFNFFSKQESIPVVAISCGCLPRSPCGMHKQGCLYSPHQ